MKRPWLWIAFGACLTVVLAAMSWVSWTALCLDRAQQTAPQQAALEENVRLALWRMDSALAPVVAQESARPYFTYNTFVPFQRIYGQIPGDGNRDMLVPSPLLAEPLVYVLVHFQFDPQGRLTAPRVPPQSERSRAVPRYLSEQSLHEAQQRLGRVAKLVNRAQLLTLLPGKSPENMPAPTQKLAGTMYDRIMVAAPALKAREPGGVQRFAPAAAPQRADAESLPVPQSVAMGHAAAAAEVPQRPATAKQRRVLEQPALDQGSAEYVERNLAFSNYNNAMAQNQVQTPVSLGGRLLETAQVSGAVMTPLWIEGQLLLARRITADGQEYVQGCLLDWPAIRTWLLASVDDLLPQADLKPVTAARPKSESHLLAGLPARLIPGQVAIDGSSLPSPVRLSLVLAWSGMLVAGGAVAALLWGVLRLSERRAAFVSAVTHELRTPLTTFHMYTEMLTEGMVPQPRQQEYLRTLRREASRLGHLVENVLAYARLERGRPGGPKQKLAVAQLLEPIRARLAERATQAGMELVFQPGDEALGAVVEASPSVVEQILFNLVDNACKYAAAAADKRIHLSVARQGRSIHIQVCDHGPGISRGAARRLRPFSKSAHEAANTAPGVGLGLALSKRLARDMGARLTLAAGPVTAETAGNRGACFTLAIAVIE